MTAKEALAVLVATYLRDKDLPDATVNIYVAKMGEIHGELLEAVIHRVIERSRFFPSIAELRQTAAELAGALPIGVEEAMAIVRAADVERPVYRRDGTYAYTEHEWAWPEGLSWKTLGVIRAALSKAGESIDVEGKRIFAWESGFKAAYEREAASVVAELDLRHARRALPVPSAPVAALPPPPAPVGVAKTALGIVQAVAAGEIPEAEAHRQRDALLEQDGQ